MVTSDENGDSVAISFNWGERRIDAAISTLTQHRVVQFDVTEHAWHNTLALLTNPEVIEVSQDALGHAGKRLVAQVEVEVWTRDLADGTVASSGGKVVKNAAGELCRSSHGAW